MSAFLQSSVRVFTVVLGTLAIGENKSSDFLCGFYAVLSTADKLQACLRVFKITNCSFRFVVKELLQNDFFLEDTGLKVELASGEEEEPTSTIQLRLRVVDPKYVIIDLSTSVLAFLSILSSNYGKNVSFCNPVSKCTTFL